MTKYEWHSEMGEISGFGGTYEQACRTMLFAGLAWLDAHSDSRPVFFAHNRIFGVVDEGNDDAKALSKVVGEAAPGCTGAMHHAVISALMFIKKNGWHAYASAMSKEK